MYDDDDVDNILCCNDVVGGMISLFLLRFYIISTFITFSTSSRAAIIKFCGFVENWPVSKTST